MEHQYSMETWNVKKKEAELSQQHENLKTPIEPRLRAAQESFEASDEYAALGNITRYGMYIDDNNPAPTLESELRSQLSENNLSSVQTDALINTVLQAAFPNIASNDQLKKEFRSVIMTEVWSDLNNAFHGKATMDYLDLIYEKSKRFSAFWNTENGLAINPNDSEIDFTTVNREYCMLRTAAMIHDWSEAIKGDVRYDLKLDTDTKAEKQVFFQLAKQHLIPNGYSQDEIEELADIIYGPDKGKESKNQKLQSIFKLVERVGYLYSGMHFWLAYKKLIPNLAAEDFDNKVKYQIFSDASQQAAVNVFLHQIKALVESAESFPGIALILLDHGHILLDIIKKNSDNQPSSTAFAMYPDYNPDTDKNLRKDKINAFNTAANLLKEYFGDSASKMVDLDTIFNTPVIN
jgi:5'-deoxynucleotidase YfbR-like HD superfamily hydrolase